ncbi:MAG: hypothetical protein FJ030_01270 [Chloroflexi bacterium]|nr:hypothetical protein [Chloroflexota bacterium]
MRNTFILHPSSFILLVAYLLYLTLILARNGGDPLALARIGHGPNEGYDGQFTYLIAVDPSPAAVVREIAEARADIPAYRYQRILLPFLARLFGLGQPALIAWAIPLINLAAQTMGAALVAQLLAELGVSRWYALVYGLWPGLAVAVRADLTEPLSYALVAAAYLFHGRERAWLSALCFGLALFAKETAMLFVAAHMAYALFARDARRLLSLTLIAVAPFIAWQFALKAMFGSFGIGSGGYLGAPFEIIPFNGVWRILSDRGLAVFAIFILFLGPWVAFPSVWGIIASAREALKRNWHPYVWALGANAAITPFTPYSTFREPVAIFRFCTGLVLATLLFGGLVKSRRVLNYSWLWLAMLVFLVKD